MNGSTESGPTEFWTRLRRRKVVQWGLVSVAGAWGFLQGLEYVSETFHWPEQIRQLSFIALLIGLPIVLVLAWYHGDRGQQRITTPEFAILTLLLLLGGGRSGTTSTPATLGAKTAHRQRMRRSVTQRPPSRMRAHPSPSCHSRIAVALRTMPSSWTGSTTTS